MRKSRLRCQGNKQKPIGDFAWFPASSHPPNQYHHLDSMLYICVHQQYHAAAIHYCCNESARSTRHENPMLNPPLSLTSGRHPPVRDRQLGCIFPQKRTFSARLPTRLRCSHGACCRQRLDESKYRMVSSRKEDVAKEKDRPYTRQPEQWLWQSCNRL